MFTSSSIRSNDSSAASTASASLPSFASSHTTSIRFSRCRKYSRIKLESSTIRARICASVRTIFEQPNLRQPRRRQLLRIKLHHQTRLHLVGAIKQPLPPSLQRARVILQNSPTHRHHPAHGIDHQTKSFRSLII